MKNINCILLVDDDEINNIICYSLINRLGKAEKIQTATNGIGALNFLRRYYMQYKYLPDLIILDIDMPIMNGLDFLRTVNNSFFMKKQNTSIVFLSNYTAEAQKTLFKIPEHLLMLEKPLDEQKLNCIIDYHHTVSAKEWTKSTFKKLYEKA
jgi:two-component SAPR family response regulator